MTTRFQLAIIFLTGLTWTMTPIASAQTRHSPSPSLPMIVVTNRHPVVRPKPDPVVPPAPAAQPQLPSAAKLVQYQDGKLFVESDGATLKDVLESIAPVIGASIQCPPQLESERVALRLGPAPPRDVLQALFAGSAYDYIIMGSDAQPDAVKNVIVRLRGSPIPPTVTAVNPDDAPTVQHDVYAEYRLPNGLSPEQAGMSREDFFQRFQALEAMKKLQEQARQQQ